MNNLQELQERLTQAETFRINRKRPFITISYAQSVNGSIASSSHKQVHLSGHQSLVLTHRLRSLCDAILIGIETVLTDNPQLTVRLVEGKNPQPIILDTRLRISLEKNLLQRADMDVWLVSGPNPPAENVEKLRQAGAKILPCATTQNGKIDLRALVELLADRHINSLMVEGGAKVITSFINAQLVDLFVITIAPKILDGLQVIEPSRLTGSNYLDLEDIKYDWAGEDLILWARPLWNNHSHKSHEIDGEI